MTLTEQEARDIRAAHYAHAKAQYDYWSEEVRRLSELTQPSLTNAQIMALETGAPGRPMGSL